MKKTGRLIVLFFSTFLCSYTFSLGKKNTSKDTFSKVSSWGPLSSKSRRHASWGRWCQSSSVLGAAAPKPGLVHQWRIQANEGTPDSDFPPPAFTSLPTAPSEFCLILVFRGLSMLWGQLGSTLWSCPGLAVGFSSRRKGEEAGARGGAWHRGRSLLSFSLHGVYSRISAANSEACLFCRFYFWMVLQSAYGHTKTMQLLLSQAVGTQRSK